VSGLLARFSRRKRHQGPATCGGRARSPRQKNIRRAVASPDFSRRFSSGRVMPSRRPSLAFRSSVAGRGLAKAVRRNRGLDKPGSAGSGPGRPDRRRQAGAKWATSWLGHRPTPTFDSAATPVSADFNTAPLFRGLPEAEVGRAGAELIGGGAAMTVCMSSTRALKKDQKAPVEQPAAASWPARKGGHGPWGKAHAGPRYRSIRDDRRGESQTISHPQGRRRRTRENTTSNSRPFEAVTRDGRAAAK